MVALIDTNIIIDFLVTREPFYDAASKIIAKCASGEVEGCVAFHSIPNLWYILRKLPEEKRRIWLADICSFMRVAAASHEEVVKAIKTERFSDFEDCLQDKCAKSINAQYIVTRNTLDFKNSEIPAIQPEEFLRLISN